MRNQYTFPIVLTLFLCLWVPPSINANTLDPDFGNNGVITTSLSHYGDTAKAVIVDENNKILVAGDSANGSDSDFSLARYNQDGSLDTTFNHNGIATTLIGSNDDHATAIALQEDGKIVVAGYTFNGTNNDFALVRYQQDGSLDTTFGSGGIVTLALGDGDDIANSVAIAADATILVAGSSDGTSCKEGSIVRLHPDGSTKSRFGNEKNLYSHLNNDTSFQDLLISENGKILVTGYSLDKQGTTLSLKRYLPNDTPDKPFGLDGTVRTDGVFPANTTGMAIALQDNGTILIAGSTGRGKSQDIALFRFLDYGYHDPSFGTQGMLSRDINGEVDGSYDIAISGDRVIIGGYATSNGLRDFVLLEYPLPSRQQQDGGLTIKETVVEESATSSKTYRSIESFNNPQGSVTTTSIDSFDDTGYGMAVQEDGKVILVGSSGTEGVDRYAVARYAKTADDSATTNEAVKKQISPATSGCITTTEIHNIKQTSAFTGGSIISECSSYGARGVVFSIVPYPVYGNGDEPEPAAKSAAKSVPLSTTFSADEVPAEETGSTKEGSIAKGSGSGQYGVILKNLAIGTRYYVRAYAVESTGATVYGNQLTFETKDACFIATSAYGSLSHPHVKQLRSFRDHCLMGNAMGRKLVDFYYNYSPAIAETMEEYPILRPVVRVILLPFIGISAVISAITG